MTTRFLVIAAVMVVVALLCVLVPLLRAARREGRPRAPFVLALVLALVTPPLVLGIYFAIGTPAALQSNAADGPAALAQATRELRANLAAKPDDAHGWALLAQAYSALNQPQEAMDALNHLLKLRPDDPDAIVAWVEAAVATDPSHLISDASREKLQHALQVDPTHQRALWLLGISDFQRGQYAGAAKQWQALLAQLQPGSKVATTVQQELAEAQARAKETPAGAGSTATPPVADASSSVALDITVHLAPALQDRLKPGDALYVFARAVDGPEMPVAATRLHPSRKPVEVVLTDHMALTPGIALSRFPKVLVAARISSSGNAEPQPGDLESAPVEVATDSRSPIALTIDRVN